MIGCSIQGLFTRLVDKVFTLLYECDRRYEMLSAVIQLEVNAWAHTNSCA
jgi:hypothetical protein